MPKGHIEPEETLQQAALREVHEETGYADVAVDADLGEQLVEFDDNGRHFERTEHYFLMSLRHPAQCPTGPGESEFVPVGFTWNQVRRALTFDAEKEWLRRAYESTRKQLAYNCGRCSGRHGRFAGVAPADGAIRYVDLSWNF